jgi:hypothetical protein
MTTASVAKNPIVRKARDTVVTLIGHLPRARKQMAIKMGRAHLMTQAAPPNGGAVARRLRRPPCRH